APALDRRRDPAAPAGACRVRHTSVLHQQHLWARDQGGPGPGAGLSEPAGFHTCRDLPRLNAGPGEAAAGSGGRRLAATDRALGVLDRFEGRHPIPVRGSERKRRTPSRDRPAAPLTTPFPLHLLTPPWEVCCLDMTRSVVRSRRDG